MPQTSGRQRLDIHGAIDLETGQTRMLEALAADTASTIMRLVAIEAIYPGKRMKSQGLQPNQDVAFLTDGGAEIITLTELVTPASQHNAATDLQAAAA